MMTNVQLVLPHLSLLFFSRPPRISSADYKKLIRICLVVLKVKLGSDASTVKKQCLALVKSHKLNVSVEDCARIASSVRVFWRYLELTP